MPRQRGSKKDPVTGAILSPKEQEEIQAIKEEKIKLANAEDISQDEYIPEQKEVSVTKDIFELKDRYYHLKGDITPVAYFVKPKFLWFDEEKEEEREIMFTENQSTPFVDEFKGEARRARLSFRDGVLHVPRNKVVWQKILSIYHPHLGKKYIERNEEAKAIDELDQMQLELDAMNLANSMDITKAESIVRVRAGSNASKMTTKEIVRDLMLFCKENPQLVIDLSNDENVEARNLGIKAVEQGFLKLTSDHRTFLWGSNNRKLFNVPFEEHPYSALVQWFKTDEGLDVYAQLENKVK